MTEWKHCELGEALTLQRGFDLPHRSRREGNVPIVSSSGISGMHDSARVCGPGIVTGRYGTIGEVFYITEEFWPLNTTLFVREFKGNDPLYLYYLLHTVDFASHRGKSGVPGINRNDIHRLPIVLPSPNEQRAIAEALSDVDRLLGTLDALNAKKRDIKQATMQQLLTGKTRLPGFGGEWVTRSIVEIADCFDNLRVPLNETERASMPGPYPYCGANGVLDYVNDFVLDDDLILIAEDGGHFDEYVHRPIAYRMTGKIWVNNHAHVLKAKADYSQGFLHCSLAHKNILPFLASATRAKLNLSEMNKIRVFLPTDHNEQEAIAAVLSDMDTEILALERRREKTHSIKRGMMQQLLTGRVRLVKPGAIAAAV